jgi:glycosyltransferase involved in cell wall biosynthesis
MHILIDAHLAIKEIDGVTRHLIGLLTELPKLDKSIRYTLLALPDEMSGLPRSIFEQPNVNRIEVNLMGPSPRQHLMMRSLLKELRVNLYHHPQFDLPMGVNVPKVITVHDLTYIFHPQFLAKRSRLKRFYIMQSLRYAVAKADRIIVISKCTLNDLAKMFNVDEERVALIYNAVALPDDKMAKAQKSTAPTKNRFILYVGTRRPHKNIPGLIKALAILRQEKNCKVDLVIAGKPYSDYREPETTTENLKLKSHVHFLDFVPDEQLPALYHQAQAVALPSFYEGFGIPVLEAMAHGKPVIASNVSALPEIVGDAGLLVDPHNPEDIADKIHAVISNKKLAEQLSKKARKRAAEFSWQNIAESTLQVYLDALRDKA